ncbi:MAG: cell division protease FtsH [Acidobacteriota bacterium]|jgi:cell division protease FtsH|nr:cell division protease FtsH [Acidobacteriota bacterium]MDT7808017.1 cell division protease FtsH [Acidobacteriota bacterium]
MSFSRSLPSKKKTTTLVVFGSLLLLVVALAVVGLINRQFQPIVRDVNFTQLRELADAGAARSVSVSGEVVTVTQGDGGVVRSVVTNALAQHEVVSVFEKGHVPVEYETMQPGMLVTVLNYLLPAAALVIFALIGWRVYASMGMQNESAASETMSGEPVTFQDVAGVDEARTELSETIDFLRDPERFGRLGGRSPRGILLSGPPGTGKTLLARAAACEAKVPFLSVSGSSFQEKFAGLGAARVRRLFARARKLAPCVIFIDEIDALGRRRGRGGDSASADQDQTLNQLLVEMDGFEQLSGVVVIASTNRPDILDSALTRPGRFDREITVNLADMRGREQILRVHSRKLKLEDGLDLGWIARGTPGFSGADLANLLNEAAIVATRDDSSAIGRCHVEYARDKILMGVERLGFMMDEDERHATAVHEAGHVAVGLAVKHGDPIHKVSILPRGRALGVTQALPERDRLMRTREYLEDQIAMLLGGRAAEILLLDTMTAGASNDIERAVEIARRMVAEFGMSPLGPIHLGKPEDPHSQTLLDRIEHATSDIINVQMKRACDVVDSRRAEIARLVAGLMERDTLDADEIRESFGLIGEPVAA